MNLTARESTNYIKSLDTGSTLKLLVSDYGGAPLDLTQFSSVTVVIANDTGRLREITADNVNAQGELNFDFDEGTILPAGRYRLEVHMDEADGELRIAPSRGDFILNIEKSIDEVGAVLNVITLQEFEDRIADAELTANTAATYATEQGDYAKAEADRLTGTDVSTLDTRVTTVESKLSETDRQTQTLQTGLNVINADVATPVDVEIAGRTLTSLGNSTLESSKYYVIADERYKLKWADATITDGVGKVTEKAERPAVIRVANFIGKVSGSTVENPHVVKRNQSGSLIAPSGFTSEHSDVGYGQIRTLNSVTHVYRTSTSGNMTQILFSFDLIAEVERQIGKIPRSTTADKVQWLKANVNILRWRWYGYGSSVGGNKASVRAWNTGGSWLFNATSTSSTVTLISNAIGSSVSDYITSDGFSHLIAYAEPSDGTTESTINTDYVELEIELKPTADFTKPSVPLYEVDSTAYAKILVDWDAATVKTRYPRVAVTQHLTNPFVIAEGENLVSNRINDWTAGLTLTADGYLSKTDNTGFDGYIEVPVKPGQAYSLSFDGYSSTPVGTTAGFNGLLLNSSGASLGAAFTSVSLSGVSAPQRFTRSFVAPSNAAKLRVYSTVVSGTVYFKNVMLTLGSTPKPFVPRNPSNLYAETKLGRIGTNADVLFRQDRTWKRRKVIEKDVKLDGSLAWIQQTDFAGYKTAYVDLGNSISESDAYLSKYNQLVLKQTKGATPTIDSFRMTGTLINLGLPDADTGFGETYAPTTAEIKAYFYGWRLNNGTFGQPYDGTGTKTWVPIGDASNARAVTVTPTADAPTISEGIIDHYKLSYARSTPVIEEVDVVGDIIADGLTQTTIGAGFTYTVDGDTGKRTYTLLSDNAKSAVTTNPVDVTARYALNIRSAHDDLANVVGDNSNQLDVHEAAIVELYARVKALETP